MSEFLSSFSYPGPQSFEVLSSLFAVSWRTLTCKHSECFPIQDVFRCTTWYEQRDHRWCDGDDGTYEYRNATCIVSIQLDGKKTFSLLEKFDIVRKTTEFHQCREVDHKLHIKLQKTVNQSLQRRCHVCHILILAMSSVNPVLTTEDGMEKHMSVFSSISFSNQHPKNLDVCLIADVLIRIDKTINFSPSCSCPTYDHQIEKTDFYSVERFSRSEDACSISETLWLDPIL